MCYFIYELFSLSLYTCLTRLKYYTLVRGKVLTEIQLTYLFDFGSKMRLHRFLMVVN